MLGKVVGTDSFASIYDAVFFSYRENPTSGAESAPRARVNRPLPKMYNSSIREVSSFRRANNPTLRRAQNLNACPIFTDHAHCRGRGGEALRLPALCQTSGPIPDPPKTVVDSQVHELSLKMRNFI